MSKDKEYFVNRHGHKADVDNAVEQIATQDQATYAGETTLKPKKTRQRSFTWPKVSKKAGLISVLLVVGLVATAFILGWFGTNEYVSRTAAIRSAARTANSNIMTPEQSAINSISAQKAKLSAIQSCAGIVPSIFTAVIPGSGNKKSECESATVSNEQLKTGLGKLESITMFLAAQQKVLEPVLREQTVNEFASIPDVTAAWQTAREKLAALPVDQNASQFKDTLVQRVKAVVSAWEQLLSANSARDTEAFKAGEAALASAYEALREGASEADTLVAGAQSAINTSYDKLLGGT